MNVQIPLSSLAHASRHQVSCELQDQVVILNMRDGTCYGLDPVGARVWALVQQPVRISSVRDALLEEFDVDRATCEADLLDLLSELAARGIVELKNEPGA